MRVYKVFASRVADQCAWNCPTSVNDHLIHIGAVHLLDIRVPTAARGNILRGNQAIAIERRGCERLDNAAFDRHAFILGQPRRLAAQNHADGSGERGVCCSSDKAGHPDSKGNGRAS